MAPATAPKPAPFSGLRDVLNTIVLSLTLLSMITGGIIFFTGGFQLKNQAVVEDLSSKMTALQRSMDAMQARFDSLPRPSDYAAQDAHLSRLDNAITDLRDHAISDLRDRIAAGEAINAAVKARVDRLEAGSNIPIRIPRN